MEKNGEYIDEVLSLGSEGEGIINCDGCTVFVPFCLPGERVKFKALKIKDGVAYGKLTEVLTPSTQRVKPVCENFTLCGGCQLQHMRYPEQLLFKQNLVKNCLKKIGGIEAKVGECIPAEGEWQYRNKLALPVGYQNGGTVIGFYAPRSHRIVPVDCCVLQRPWSAKLVATLKKFMAECRLNGYDEENKKGDIRQIVAREVEGRLIITVVAAHNISLEKFAEILSDEVEKFTLLLNINGSTSNVIFGKEWHICRGDGFFYGQDMGIRFKAGANTFLQVNDGVRTKLYEYVVKNICNPGAVAIDLYSGGGMLTALLARGCRAAYGIEVVKEAVVCADELKNLNNLSDKMFNICGRVEDELEGVFAATEGAERVIVCDPPRKGMERSVVNCILKSGADRVALISCNPATLARDLGLLCGTLKEEDGKLIKSAPGESKSGYYSIRSITPFDMFPQTKHVETVVVLNRG